MQWPHRGRLEWPHLDAEMPERFVLEALTATGDWVDHGLFARDDFGRLDDGSHVCQGGGSPTLLRCLRQDGIVVYAVDSQDDPFSYRLVAFPGGGYAPT